jgi:hypothetical protein
MNGNAPKNTYIHVKTVLVGMLVTNSPVRAVADILYQQKKYDLLVSYLHTMGMPQELTLDDLSAIFDSILGGGTKGPALQPLDVGYDQNNCDYVSLMDAGSSLDTQETA